MVLSLVVLRFLGVDSTTCRHADLNPKADLECQNLWMAIRWGNVPKDMRQEEGERNKPFLYIWTWCDSKETDRNEHWGGGTGLAN